MESYWNILGSERFYVLKFMSWNLIAWTIFNLTMIRNKVEPRMQRLVNLVDVENMMEDICSDFY